jgi:hypothetical protein
MIRRVVRGLTLQPAAVYKEDASNMKKRSISDLVILSRRFRLH